MTKRDVHQIDHDQPLGEAAEAFREAYRAWYRAQYGDTCVYCCGTVGAAPDDPSRCICGERPAPKPEEN